MINRFRVRRTLYLDTREAFVILGNISSGSIRTGMVVRVGEHTLPFELEFARTDGTEETALVVQATPTKAAALERLLSPDVELDVLDTRF